jgi:hypothetical protein
MSKRLILTFADVLYECANTPDFAPLFNSLTGCHLTPQSAPESADVREFVEFVATYVWEPLLAERARAAAAEESAHDHGDARLGRHLGCHGAG